jgi:ribosomal-protein-alanine N-acetyltransferase
MTADDLPEVVETEQAVFSDPWSPRFFLSLLEQPETHARVAEREGRLAGYSISVLRPPTADLENIATVPGQRRNGVARALLDDAIAACEAASVRDLTLEVRVSNDAAQSLYRAYGFRLAGLRPGYYRHPEEDALLMTRTLGAVATPAGRG